MAQPDDETAKELIESADVSAQYVAIKMMVEGLVEVGFTTGEALYWSAVHVAALNKMPDYEPEGETDAGG